MLSFLEQSRPRGGPAEQGFVRPLLLAEIDERLAHRGALELVPFEACHGDSHEPSKFRIVADGERIGFLICSSPEASDIVERATTRSRSAQEMLGEELGAAVVTPLFDGIVAGRSYAVYTHLHPLRALGSRRVGRWLALPQVFRWLRGAARTTKREGDRATYADNLEHLATLEGLSTELRKAVDTARTRLENGSLTPLTVLTHADLWEGNVLFHAGPTLGEMPQIRLIDWAAAQLQGAPAFDLVRATSSFRTSRQTLIDELAEHARILDAPPGDLGLHLLSALGCSGRHRENFPLGRYIGMVEGCYGDCAAALARLACVVLSLGLTDLPP
jgi:hypothetical protein